MGKHDFRYFFHEGLSNMFSHGFMSFAAIGITVACLLIMGTFTLVAVNANGLLVDLEQENEILAYVDDSYTLGPRPGHCKASWRRYQMSLLQRISAKRRPWRILKPNIRTRSCFRIWIRRFWRTVTPLSW